MRYQKERCAVCGSPSRPTDLDEYTAVLKPDGQISNTYFWVCSVKCFDKAVNEFIDNDYLFGKYWPFTNDYSPLLKKQLDEVMEKWSRIHDIVVNYSRKVEEREPEKDFTEHTVQKIREEQKPIKDAWIAEQKRQGRIAIGKLLDRAWAEHQILQDKEFAEDNAWMEKEEKYLLEEGERIEREAEQTRLFIERTEERRKREEERVEEKRLRDEERRKREEERLKREQERLDEKREREEEKRQKEEAERAAKQAEEEKWEPQDFGNI